MRTHIYLGLTLSLLLLLGACAIRFVVLLGVIQELLNYSALLLLLVCCGILLLGAIRH